jgi:membrane associated rhomboid family serine protease
MIPLRDDNPTHRPAILTGALIAVSVYVFFWIQPSGVDSVEFLYSRATIPCEVTTLQALDRTEIVEGVCSRVDSVPYFADKSISRSLIESMFMHANLVHLVSNMWVFWIFGNNVEDRLGRLRFLLFYLLTGLTATFAHVVFNQASTIPVIGASGAIAGVMGAYLVLFPHARVVSVIPPLFLLPFRVPAVIFLLLWLFAQFSISANDPQVAWIAHVGGFVAGAAYTLMARRRLRQLR